MHEASPTPASGPDRAPLVSIPRPAGRLLRLLAWFLDSLTFVPAGVCLEIARWGSAAPFGLPRWAWFALVGLLAAPVLGVDLAFLRRNGWTIGKRVLGIRIVRSDGSPATLVRIVCARMAFMWLSESLQVSGSLNGTFVGLSIFLLDVVFILGPKRRCLHDRLADTIVVDTHGLWPRWLSAPLPVRAAAR